MNVLIVDDEKLIRDVIKEYLLLENINVLEASDGKEAIDIIKKNNIDIIVMDIMMPQMDGYTAYKKVKEIKTVPCIMLSARTEEYDKLLGFDLGVDDYITKPFSPKEVIARIKAVTKRLNINQDKIEYQGICIDNLAHEVLINGIKIELTPKEYDLLKYLMQNKNIALSRENLLNNIWGYDFYGDDRTIDTHIKTLRGHLGEYREYIKTVRGMGYKFEAKEEK